MQTSRIKSLLHVKKLLNISSECCVDQMEPDCLILDVIGHRKVLSVQQRFKECTVIKRSKNKKE